MKCIAKRMAALALVLTMLCLTLPASAFPAVSAASVTASAQTREFGASGDLTVDVGSLVTFSLQASGTDLSYQWYYKKAGAANWSKWNGHTGASTSATANASWNGMQVYCVIKDGAGGTMSSNPLTIYIKGADQITVTAQPKDVAVKVGTNVSFTVGAYGTGLSYQWYYKKKGASAWSIWKGHTTPTTKATANATWNGMQVYCLIKDSSGNTAASNPAKITVAGDLYIINQPPQTLSVLNGGPATVNVEASGTGLKYQWYYKKKGAANWSKWNGHTTAITSATANATWDGMQVYCVITDVIGTSVSSKTCTFSVDGNESLDILRQPQNVTVKAGETVSFSVQARGVGVKYQWYYKKAGAANWSKWNGHTTATTKATANATWNGMQVYCHLTDADGIVRESDIATVSITAGAKKADTVGVDAKTHTQAEIKAYIKKLNIDSSVNVTYAEEPVTWGGSDGKAYQPGKLSGTTLGNALNILNSIRYVAGIPDTVKLDDTYNTYCQAGALVNYANDDLDHYPPQPAGMSDELYKLGYKGSSSSNIAWTSWKTGLHYMLVDQWLDDSDAYNISALGHRRWLLNPTMGKTGFGLVRGSNGTYGQFYSIDRSGISNVNTVVWPAQQTPLEYFPSDSAWSISSSSAFSSDILVKLERIRGGNVKAWNMRYGADGSVTNDGYINCNTMGYGVSNCIIFRPNEQDYQAGDIYNVYLYESGKLTKSYSVTFFHLD